MPPTAFTATISPKPPALGAGWLVVPKLPLVAKAEQNILPTAATTPAPLSPLQSDGSDAVARQVSSLSIWAYGEVDAQIYKIDVKRLRLCLKHICQDRPPKVRRLLCSCKVMELVLYFGRRSDCIQPFRPSQHGTQPARGQPRAGRKPSKSSLRSSRRVDRRRAELDSLPHAMQRNGFPTCHMKQDICRSGIKAANLCSTVKIY